MLIKRNSYVICLASTILVVMSSMTPESASRTTDLNAISRTVVASDTVEGQPGSSDKDVQALVVVLRPYGFDPVEIDVAAGRYLMVVQNRSGARDLTFHL